MPLTRFAVLALFGAAVIAGGSVLAQKPSEQVFKDKQGRLKLWNMDSHEVKVQNEGPLLFEGTGRPIRGQSQDQGINLEALKLIAELENLKSGYVLKSADLSGAVNLTQEKAGTKTNLQSAELKIDDSGTEAKVALAKPFTMVQDSAATATESASKRTLKAGSATILLDSFRLPNGKLRSADARGSVDFNLTEAARRLNLKSASAKLEQTAETLTFTFPSAFTLVGWNQPKPGEENDINAAADSGTGKVAEKVKRGENSLISLDLKGNVVLKAISKAKVTEGERTRVLNAKGARLTFDRATGLMTLSGGVTYTIEVREPGEEPIEAEGASETLLVTFDQAGNLLNATAKSGSTRISEGQKP